MREPWEEDEIREKAWDDKMNRAPKCECCGRSIALYDSYLNLNGVYYCESCVEDNTHRWGEE